MKRMTVVTWLLAVALAACQTGKAAERSTMEASASASSMGAPASASSMGAPASASSMGAPASGSPMGAPPSSQQPAAEGEAPKDPLVALNQQFRQEYKQAKAAALAKVGPVILTEGDTLVLLRGGTREEGPLRPPLYHQLKAVAHVPLALHVLLSADAGGPLSEARLGSLRRYRELMIAARDGFSGQGLSAEQTARQRRIFDESAVLLDGVLARGRIGKDGLAAYIDRIRAPMNANITEATHAQMELLYATVGAWRKKLSPAEWASLHVVIISAHMPREDEVGFQFFSRLLNEPFEGRRIVYAEGLWQEPQALDLLATHLVDGGVGEAFFNDARRMHRDLLADVARAYLDAHPVQP